MDCGSFFCDFGTGFCVEKRPAGDPVGAPCDVRIVDPDVPEDERPEDTCAGRCLSNVDASGNLIGAACYGYCTSGTLGTVVNCGSSPNGVTEAGCLFVFDGQSGAGDIGACGQLCECDSDCHDPASGCEDFATGTNYTEDQYRQAFGQAGYCRANPDNPRTCP